jgi:hypothetical protein
VNTFFPLLPRPVDRYETAAPRVSGAVKATLRARLAAGISIDASPQEVGLEPGQFAGTAAEIILVTDRLSA